MLRQMPSLWYRDGALLRGVLRRVRGRRSNYQRGLAEYRGRNRLCCQGNLAPGIAMRCNQV